MNATLTKALEGLDLQPGQTYQATVNGHKVEVRVLDDDDDVPTPEFADQVMLLPWVEFPFNAAGTVTARPGKLPLPDPPVIPEEEGDGE